MFNKSYNIAAAERANKELSKSTLKLNVKLLDDSYETFNITTSAIGQTLLDTVCDCIEIMERDYFGICYTSVDSKSNVAILKWMKMNKLIRKQLKGDSELRSLCFRMRFIPADVGQMQEAYTRYQLFLQIKQDILNNNLQSPRSLSVQLAGLSLQSELGDYNQTIMKPGYEAEFRFVSDQNGVFEADVVSYHETLKGVKPDDAEFKYLTAAKSIPQYGCDMYSAELLSVKCQFGFNAHGIAVFPTDPKDAYLIPWNSVDKVSNKAKYFQIKIILHQPIISIFEMGLEKAVHHGKPMDMIDLHQKHSSTLKFLLPTPLAAKEIWLNCIETHAFFRMRDPYSSTGGTGLKKSYSFFKTSSVSRASSFFSGRRTLSELLDIRRRNRTLDRSFVRVPSKRYNRRASHLDKSQNIIHGKGRGSVSGSVLSNNKTKVKVEIVKPKDTIAISESSSGHSGSSDESPSHSPEQSNFRSKVAITQSVRIPRTHGNKPFQAKTTSHTSLPRKHLQPQFPSSKPHQPDIQNDIISPDNGIRASIKSDNRTKPLVASRQSTNLAELKGSKMVKSSSTSSGLGDGPMASNPALNQSHDRIVDPDAVVDIVVKAPLDGRYGFSIKGGIDTKSHVIVTKVKKGSPADACTPRLCEGDQIIRINDRVADELTNDQIKEIIRSSGQKKDTSLVLCVKQRLYFGESSDENSVSEDPKSPPVPVKTAYVNKNSLIDLKSEMKMLDESIKNGSALHEFEKLYKQKHGLTMNDAKKQENLSKNRYKDILPYDQTRISIRNKDYINANLIKMEVPNCKDNLCYIAAQGPMKGTASDFIQMIWEQRISLIVMLTELSEQGRAKCYQYWPDEGESMKHSGGFVLNCESEESVLRDGVVTVRKLKLRKQGEAQPRYFTMMQYRNWPDHDVPQDMDELINLVKLIKQHRSANNNPILVHCSAGIGRTGVVITMDIAISYIESKQPFSVLSIVKDIRNQRAMLVQSQKQYKFVCQAVLHYYSNFSKT